MHINDFIFISKHSNILALYSLDNLHDDFFFQAASKRDTHFKGTIFNNNTKNGVFNWDPFKWNLIHFFTPQCEWVEICILFIKKKKILHSMNDNLVICSLIECIFIIRHIRSETAVTMVTSVDIKMIHLPFEHVWICRWYLQLFTCSAPMTNGSTNTQYTIIQLIEYIRTRGRIPTEFFHTFVRMLYWLKRLCFLVSGCHTFGDDSMCSTRGLMSAKIKYQLREQWMRLTVSIHFLCLI